jgi:hypothetical protein
VASELVTAYVFPWIELSSAIVTSHPLSQ